MFTVTTQHCKKCAKNFGIPRYLTPTYVCLSFINNKLAIKNFKFSFYYSFILTIKSLFHYFNLIKSLFNVYFTIYINFLVMVFCAQIWCGLCATKVVNELRNICLHTRTVEESMFHNLVSKMTEGSTWLIGTGGWWWGVGKQGRIIYTNKRKVKQVVSQAV